MYVLLFQKINHFENEASKALSLAKTSQEKVKELETQIATLNTEIISLNTQIQNLEYDYNTEKDRNLSFLEQMEQKSRELREVSLASI